jgi:putative zinc finger protein
MRDQFHCQDKEQLISYLYEEGGDEERAAVETHLLTCAACREEVSDLRNVRGDLGLWQPPDADFTVRIVRDAPVARRAWWQVPVWATSAIAAGLVLAIGAAAANLEVQVGNGTLTVRTGWSKPVTGASAQVQQASVAQPASPSARPALVSAGMSEAEVRKALDALEGKLRTDFARMPSQAGSVQRVATGNDVDRGALLSQVRSLVDESERRQQRELALRLAQVVQDFDAQRRTDLVRIEQGFGQIESLTGQEAARQREITNYLVRASQRQPQ